MDDRAALRAQLKRITEMPSPTVVVQEALDETGMTTRSVVLPEALNRALVAQAEAVRFLAGIMLEREEAVRQQLIAMFAGMPDTTREFLLRELARMDGEPGGL